MKDSIERQDAIDYFVTNVGWRDEDGDPVDDSDELRKIWTDLFNGVPSAQPERKRGKWIIKETAYEDVEAKCSCCGFETLVNQPSNGLHMINDLHFCPNCGADMRGEEDGR